MVIAVKSTKYFDEIKNKSVEELNTELVTAKKELFNLRIQNATNQLNNTARITDVRKNIARINTVISQKKMGLVK
jgi:large subunit ribosomal protein L29